MRGRGIEDWAGIKWMLAGKLPQFPAELGIESTEIAFVEFHLRDDAETVEGARSLRTTPSLTSPG